MRLVGGGVFLLTPLFSTEAYAASQRMAVAEGNRLYKKGDFEHSLEKYQEALQKNPESDIIHFNMGTAVYKQDEYERAIEHLQKALLSEDDDLKEKAHYNLGNAFYMAGIAKEDKDIFFAIASLQKALKQYENALSVNKNDEDARYNHDFVGKELERLLEKQKQSRQNQQRQEPPKEENKQERSAESESQGPEGQEAQREQQTQGQQQQGQQESEQGMPAQDRQDQPSTESDERTQRQPQSQPQGGHQEGQSPRAGNAQEMTQQEAEMLLEGYGQREEPQGLLNILQGKRDTAPVLKDW